MALTRMTKTIEVTLKARDYEDHDDSLAAAVEQYAKDADLEAWQVTARWGESRDTRDKIVITAPRPTRMAITDLVYASGLNNRDGTGTLRIVCEQAIMDGEGTPERVREIWAEAAANHLADIDTDEEE